jgi:hypothetical protein
MKRIFQVLFLALIAIGYTACQPDSFREVFPKGDPQVTANMLTKDVNFGSGSISFEVTITEKETPLSTLAIKVIVGMNVIASEEVRTPDLMFKDTFTYAIPFGPNMPEGEPVKVYLTATNVEGTTKDLILNDCIGHRPALETMYAMPPTIDYKPLGKGKQMTWDGEKFTAVDLSYPKSIECLLAVVGTKFGRVDWNYPVLGMLNGQLSLITEEQFNAGEATPIVLANDNIESIDTITFDPLTFDLYFGGKVAQPVSALDVNVDLAEVAGKTYRYSKIFFDPTIEVTINGVSNMATAYNLDYMEVKSNNVVKFLGEKGMYDVYYLPEEDYIVVEPLKDAVYPNVMWMTGVGFGLPVAAPKTQGGWGFDNLGQYIACRTVAPKVYQFTAYMKNGVNADFETYGSLNFKFFHQKGWGGEEVGGNYEQIGLPIQGVGPEGLTKVNGDTGAEAGNWIAATQEEFEGIYRITLDQNNFTTTYEKIR